MVKRFISEEPRLAYVMKAVDLGLLPKDVKEWATSWVEDVGRVVRSREMMVGFVASVIYYTGIITVLSVVEKLGYGQRLPVLRKVRSVLKL